MISTNCAGRSQPITGSEVPIARRKPPTPCNTLLQVLEDGEGELEPERDTDFDPSLAKKRYLVFKVCTCARW